MEQIPKQVTDLLQAMTRSLPVILKNSFTGIYLYGSLTQDAFDPRRSDIDCIVVTRDEITESQFIEIDRWFSEMARTNTWTDRLQVTFLVRNLVLTMDGPGCLFQFGKLVRCGSDGNPIIWLNVLADGKTLSGERPDKFVVGITPKMIAEALTRETIYILDEFENPKSDWRNRPKYRAYAVLTLCRILYTHVNETVVSKPAAAAWAIGAFPAEFHTAIGQSINAETDDDIGDIDSENIRKMIAFTMDRLLAI